MAARSKKVKASPNKKAPSRNVVNEAKVTPKSDNKKAEQKNNEIAMTTDESLKERKLKKSVEGLRRNLITQRRLMLLGLLIILVLLGYVVYKYMFVAWVDRMPLTRLDFYQRLEQKYGHDMREQMVSEKLVESEAQKRGAVVTPQEVDERVKKVEDQQGGAEQLAQALASRSITMAEFRNQTRLGIMIEKMFGKDVSISDDDVKKYITDNKETLPATINDTSSESAKLKENIKDDLRSQKIGTSFNEWLQEALKGNRVSRVGVYPTPAPAPGLTAP